MPNYVSSVDRAIRLLNTPPNYSDYILIKIAPERPGCCCLNHWATTWQTIDEFIYPDSPIQGDRSQNEGDTLIHKGELEFVLECHETGPEIIIYLGIFVITAELIKSIADLIAAIINARIRDELAITYLYTLRTFGNGRKKIQEEVINLKIPSTAFHTQQLKNYVQDSVVAGIHKHTFPDR